MKTNYRTTGMSRLRASLLRFRPGKGLGAGLLLACLALVCACSKDSDNDGMPDEWEIRYGLNPNDASDAVKDCNGDGYTNIEKYINGINPQTKTDWRNLNNNYDTLAAKGKL